MAIKWEQDRPQGPTGLSPFHTWKRPGGRAHTEFYRTENGYLLRFLELADFEISTDTENVTCFPAPSVSDATAEHLYLNQVLPLVLGKRGKLVFHASAVEIEGGAVAFVAASGKGKSTLAASFVINGYRLLTDDGLVLEYDGRGFVVQPSHPFIRLWEDSQEALIPMSARTAPALDYACKAKLLADDNAVFCDQPRPLRKVYFLGNRAAATIEVRRLGPSESLAEWLQHSFLLDVEERTRLASHFDQVATLAQHAIHYRLDYPRRYHELDNLREFIFDHVREMRNTEAQRARTNEAIR